MVRRSEKRRSFSVSKAESATRFFFGGVGGAIDIVEVYDSIIGNGGIVVVVVVERGVEDGRIDAVERRVWGRKEILR